MLKKHKDSVEIFLLLADVAALDCFSSDYFQSDFES